MTGKSVRVIVKGETEGAQKENEREWEDRETSSITDKKTLSCKQELCGPSPGSQHATSSLLNLHLASLLQDSKETRTFTFVTRQATTHGEDYLKI